MPVRPVRARAANLVGPQRDLGQACAAGRPPVAVAVTLEQPRKLGPGSRREQRIGHRADRAMAERTPCARSLRQQHESYRRHIEPEHPMLEQRLTAEDRKYA